MMLEHWLDCPGILQARLDIFGRLPLKHYLCPDSQVFRASRSHWQDVLCDDLVRTPSSTPAAAAAAAASAAGLTVAGVGGGWRCAGDVAVEWFSVDCESTDGTGETAEQRHCLTVRRAGQLGSVHLPRPHAIEHFQRAWFPAKRHARNATCASTL